MVETGLDAEMGHLELNFYGDLSANAFPDLLDGVP